MQQNIKAFFSLIIIITIYSCSSTKHLKENEFILRRINLNLETNGQFADRGILKDELMSTNLQKPNTYLFGIAPVKVWLYNIRYKKYQNDTSNFQITSKVVEKPVIFDSTLIPVTEERMKSVLKNDGYFYAEVGHGIKYKKKKATVKYSVKTSFSYLIDSFHFDIQDSVLKGLSAELRKNSLFLGSTYYSNTLAGTERARIANVIRNNGYYKFSAENIFFELDTLTTTSIRSKNNLIEGIWTQAAFKNNKEKRSINIKIIIRPTDNELAFQKYHFKKVVVFPNYKDATDFRDSTFTVKTENGTEFRYHGEYVHTSVLDKKIFIRSGKEYSETDYNRTIRELNDLGIFKYVRLFIFANQADSLNNALTCYILLSPTKKFDFNTNLEVSSGGNFYMLGSAVNVSVTDKNFLKGANQLTTTLAYGVEIDQNQSKELPFFKQFYFSSQNFGLNFRLSFPKFILPISQNRFSQNNLPKTILDAGITSMNRISYFSLRSYNASFGYIWKETDIKSWTVKPVFVNVIHLSNIDSLFKLRMDSIPAIKNSYQETFIEGESIEYIINTEGRKKAQHAFVKLGLEEAGALMSGIKATSNLLGSELTFKHAQYVRLDFDLRQYFLSRNSSLIFRFYGGIGIPYGESTVLPYIKQYYTGGAYSLRGWRPRLLGPGSYYDPKQQNSADNLFLDQAGDIKLELNGEYRFNLIKLFSGAIKINGAVFTDAGNIWLARKDPQLVGTNFEFKTLYQDIALSSGAGLRADFGGFFVLRFDWAVPLKQPYIFENHGWVINQIDFQDVQWRKKNINFNLAIGYPF